LVKDTGLGKAWQTMEELQKEGKTKSIGVSNYRIEDLEETLKVAKVRFWVSHPAIPGRG
jgi:diketogulonate reductase-like aldo/keto reductase